MSDLSPRLDLPYLLPGQAQKHVTVNEALARLDLIVQAAVLDRDRTVPPVSPEDGDRHIVAAGASGDWDGQDGRIAHHGPGGWEFVTPRAGWSVQVMSEGLAVVFDGTAWVGPEAQNLRLASLGIDTPADPVNRLAITSAATLFSHAGAGHQIKLNKAAAADTASLLYQTDFSGRAEIGLAGSDDLAVKVSADGSAWTIALQVAGGTGRVDMPQGLSLAPGTAGGPGLVFGGDPDTGLFQPAADVLGLAAGGAERARVTTGGFQVSGLVSGTAVVQSATDANAGRLLTPGYMGLGGAAIELTASDNLNALTQTGFYFNQTGANTPGNNYPVSSAGALLNIRRDSSRMVQIFTRYGNSGDTWVRSMGAGSVWTAWTRLFSQANILGTVAQSGGVPTGAVIERGSNANGDYTRFADGTQICSRSMAASASAAATWTFPAAFSAAPIVNGSVIGTVLSAVCLDAAPTTTAATFSARDKADARRADTCHLTAIGRWF